MKKLLHTLLLGALTTGALAQSNSISGTVTDCLGDPVTGHPVYIMVDTNYLDTSYYSYSIVVYTDSLGQYSNDVPYLVPTGTTESFTVSTSDPGSPWSYYSEVFYPASSGNSYTFDVTVNCPPPPTDTIHTIIYGHVYDCSGHPMPFQPVWAAADSTMGMLGVSWYGSTYTDSINGFYMLDVSYSGAATLPFPVIISTPNPSPYPGYTTDTVYIYDTTSVMHEINTSCPPYPCEVSFFSWYDSTGVLGGDTVYLYVSYSSITPAAASFTWDYGDSSTGTGAYTVHAYAVDGTYTVCVTVDNPVDSCSTTYCHDIDFTTMERASGFILKTMPQSLLGIKEPAKQETSFTVYPNPADNQLNIKSNAGIKTAKIFDMSGRQVMNVNMSGIQSNFNLDISNLENGSYILSLYNENNGLLHSHTVLKH